MTTRVDSVHITDGVVTEAKLQTKLNPDNAVSNNAFNIGVLGFKLAVNDGLTVFNLVDGVVDEFHDNTGVDTAENSNAIYDATSDFFSNQSGPNPYPGSPYVVSDFTSPGTYTAPATTTAINLLVVGGGGGGGGINPQHGGSGGGGAGGLIYLNNLSVTPGSTYSVTIGEGGAGGEASNSPAGNGASGGDTTFVYSPSVSIIGEGGGGGSYSDDGAPGGSGGGNGNSPPVAPDGGEGTQSTNHPVTGLSDFEGTAYVNSPPSFSSEGSEQVGSFGNNSDGPQNYGFGGGGAGSTQFPRPGFPGSANSNGGEALDYNILDGSTAKAYAGGGGASDGGTNPQYEFGLGGSGDEGGLSGGPGSPFSPGTPGHGIGVDGVANTGGGGGGAYPGEGGDGADGRVIVATSRTLTTNTSMTLISDTFTANAAPSTARIVIFAELLDDINSEISASVTRDNTTFNSVTLTDEGYSAGSSGIKIFSGSTSLTGSASPQVRLRWKIVGASLEGQNKIHGVSLQWK